MKKRARRTSISKVYDHNKIEKKWQRKWASTRIYESKENSRKGKYYVLDMFPYPSGEGLHVGHPKGYIATDVVSRMKRMQGYSVLHPMGFDAFGLPAENYAIKTRTNPADAVKRNVARFKRQLEIIGLDYDWTREINTTDPKYYKWTQWIFLQLFKKGLAYQSFEPINWCPSCKTGLANEDIEDGRCERCSTPVEKKPMRQWVLKITDYAERLLQDLEARDASGSFLLDWPDSIKELQKNWIGKSEGAIINFRIKNSKLKNELRDIEVFTTRPDTLFGVTYVVLAPEHRLVPNLLNAIENKKEAENYINKAKGQTEIQRTDAGREKTGVELKGIKVINPTNGEEVPVFVADYVLADYGTGAVMAVPAHDERDWDFAVKYQLPIKPVIIPYFENKAFPVRPGLEIIKRDHIDCILRNPKTDEYAALKWNDKYGWTGFIGGGIDDGESAVDAGKREIVEETGYLNVRFIGEIGRCFGGGYAAHKDQNRFSDIVFLSFELIDDSKSEVSEIEKDKHVLVWLSKEKMSEFLNIESSKYGWNLYLKTNRSHTGPGLLINSAGFDGRDSDSVKKEMTEYAKGKWTIKYKLRDWVFSRQRYWGEPIPLVHCPKCGVVPVPEKDLPVVLPKIRSYEPTGTGESPLAAITEWVNVKCPVCKGPARRETNTMPQWPGSSWYYLRYEDPTNGKKAVGSKRESYWSPVDLYVGGAEHATRHLIYARFWHKFLYDTRTVSTIEPFRRLQHVGLIMGEDGRKMSKRFGNVINPDDIVGAFGADTLRIYEMFMGPFDQQIDWNTSSMVGARRFIEKVWRLRKKVLDEKTVVKPTTDSKNPVPASANDRIIHKTIKKVTGDIASLRFNTAISALMIAINELEKAESLSRVQYESLLKLLAPFAPHATEELWSSLGNRKSVHISAWPEFDPTLMIQDSKTIIVQINGKVRGSFMSTTETSKEELERSARQLPAIQKWLEGKSIEKIVVVPQRLVNIVCSQSFDK